MLFDHCATCQRCCVVDLGHPPLEVTLTHAESSRFGSLCIENNCTFLGSSGCTLGEDKPFSCSLYPLSYDPHVRRFSIDSECPINGAYIEQLDDDGSEASRHLKAMNAKVSKLEKTDPDFLARNHEVDIDYFDLIELPIKSSVQGNRK
jgi:Fe-S-cluster containining protein